MRRFWMCLWHLYSTVVFVQMYFLVLFLCVTQLLVSNILFWQHMQKETPRRMLLREDLHSVQETRTLNAELNVACAKSSSVGNIKINCCCCWLFNDGHILQLWSETVTDGHMIIGDECCQNFLTFLFRLREKPGKTSTRKLTRPEIEPRPAGWQTTVIPSGHSGAHL